MIRIETFRKLLILAGLVLCSISDGYIFGQMSGMVDDLQRGNNTDIILSDGDVSWIASVINATSVCGFGIVGIVTEIFGRRKAITILTLPLLATWIMIYYAHDMTTFIISRVIVGISFGGVLILIYIAMAEYTTPKKRAIFVNIISAIGPSIGTTVGHILCIAIHWRTVALIGIIPSGLSALLPLLWVESPSWLASKGRFEECAKAFRALHGKSDETEKELKLLINVVRNKQKNIPTEKHAIFALTKKFTTAMKKKAFWRIMLLGVFINIYRIAGCRYLFNTMAITILKEVTGSSDIFLHTMLVDGFIILGALLPCFLLNKMKMRTLIFSFGLVSNILLVILSICLYFKSEVNLYFSWIISSILALYFIMVHAGPYAVLEILLAEIFPLDIKAYCIFMMGILGASGTFLSVKLANNMISVMGYHGIFLFNSCIVFICLAYLWVFMPETKGRTLPEIELFFKKNKFEDAKYFSGVEVSETLL